ncbi:MAG: isoprenylcysteine carboxylmethyltransferase family protein [Candidatus Melainabacteria bacterium]|nr:MAG: isoprenylcysteine carboxylmethyltransferase family protein [Candidatus Melainabacteria bacterium]
MKIKPYFLYSLVTAIFYGIIGTIMFIVAGTTELPFMWITLGLQLFLSLIALALLDEDLLKERARPQGQDKDKFSVPALSGLYFGQLAFAAYDVGQLHMSDDVPDAIKIVALILLSVGWVGSIWAMRENKFFSSAVRIQEDRGQKVISSGPYHFIRHPGYIFGSLLIVFQGLAIGSWLSVLPGLIIVGVLVNRTLLEEKMLFESLPGYKEYAQSTRFRWVPGIW